MIKKRLFLQPSLEGFLLSKSVKYNIFIIKDFTSDISYIIIYINKAVNIKNLKGYNFEQESSIAIHP